MAMSICGSEPKTATTISNAGSNGLRSKFERISPNSGVAVQPGLNGKSMRLAAEYARWLSGELEMKIHLERPNTQPGNDLREWTRI